MNVAGDEAARPNRNVITNQDIVANATSLVQVAMASHAYIATHVAPWEHNKSLRATDITVNHTGFGTDCRNGTKAAVLRDSRETLTQDWIPHGADIIVARQG